MVFDGPESIDYIEVVLCLIQEAVESRNTQKKEEEKLKKAKKDPVGGSGSGFSSSATRV